MLDLAQLMVLERLARTDTNLLPADLRLACFECPHAAAFLNAADISALPQNWVQDENATWRIGDQWRRERASPVLVAPSAILPEESNYVLNTQHPGTARLHLIRERPITFEAWLI
jgi:RES domain-containing protein